MLSHKPKVVRKELTQPQSKIHYFQSQITECTPHNRSCRRPSPSFHCPSNENHDHSNIKQKIRPNLTENSRGKSLRQQINQKLQQVKTKKHPESFSNANEVYIEPLSSIRKMLTEQTPSNEQQKEERERAIRLQNRAKEQAEFQLRQSQMILQKKQKQELAKAEQLKREIKECTFKPRLTVYRRL